MKNLSNIQDIQDIQQFQSLEFIAKQVVEGFITGLHKSPYHGFSVEFAEHRLYNTGESTRYIDWKLYARSERLFVKRFEEETNLRSHIIIDTSSSMFFPFQDKQIINKLDFSIYCAAALVHLFRKQRDAVGLTLFSEQIELQSESKLSLQHSRLIYSELEKLLFSTKNPLKKQTRASKVLHEIAEKIHKRSLVIIFSDMFDSEKTDELFSALQHFRHNKHEVILFQVTDEKKEKDFKYENRPYRFIDMETGEMVKFNPNDIRKEYVQRMEEFYNTIKLKCGQYNIDLIQADINGDFKEVLIPYLIKRSKLF